MDRARREAALADNGSLNEEKLSRLRSVRLNLPEIGVILVPMMIEQFFAVVCVMIISMLLGQTGTAEVSGYNLGENLNLFITQLIVAVGVGASVVVAQYRGRDDPEASGDAGVQALAIVLAVSLVLTAICLVFRMPVMRLIYGGVEREVMDAGALFFMLSVCSYPLLGVQNCSFQIIRGSGYSRHTMLPVVLVNVMYTLFSWLLAVVLGYGMMGVGAALIACRVFGAAYGLILVKRGNDNIRVRRMIPRGFDADKIKVLLRISVPVAIEGLIFQSGRFLTQTFAIPLGTDALAANSIANTVSGFVNMPGSAFQLAVVPLVGKYIGMGERVRAKRMAGDCLLLSIAATVLLSAAIFAALGPLISAFGQTAGINATLRGLILLYMGMTLVLWAPSFMIPSAMRAAGDVNMATVVTMVSMFVFRVSLAYYFTNYTGLGLTGVWLGMYCDWAFRSLVFMIRYKRGKWLNYKLV